MIFFVEICLSCWSEEGEEAQHPALLRSSATATRELHNFLGLFIFWGASARAGNLRVRHPVRRWGKRSLRGFVLEAASWLDVGRRTSPTNSFYIAGSPRQPASGNVFSWLPSGVGDLKHVAHRVIRASDADVAVTLYECLCNEPFHHSICCQADSD